MPKSPKSQKIKSELSFYGESLESVIQKLQAYIDMYPDRKFIVETELDYSDCYYESDAPFSRLVISEV